jgi:hypothetical protein
MIYISLLYNIYIESIKNNYYDLIIFGEIWSTVYIQ